MTRYPILMTAVLAFGVTASAQTSSNNQTGASAGVQTSTSATASAGSAHGSAAGQNRGSKPGLASTSTSASTGSALTGSSGGASASSGAGGSSLDLQSGTAMQAALVTALDAKHNKPGDMVVAKTTQDVKQDGHVVLKKGSELRGHVTEVQARSSQNAESSIGLAFDHAVPRGQHDLMPVNLSLQALAAAQSQAAGSVGGDESMLGGGGQAGFAGAGSAGGGLARGAGGAVGGVMNTAGGVAGNAGGAAGGTLQGGALQAANRTVASAGSTGGLNAVGQLTSNSSGVFNLEGVNLSSAVSNGTQASVVSSATRNVQLASGTQMVLQAAKQ